MWITRTKQLNKHPINPHLSNNKISNKIIGITHHRRLDSHAITTIQRFLNKLDAQTPRDFPAISSCYHPR